MMVDSRAGVRWFGDDRGGVELPSRDGGDGAAARGFLVVPGLAAPVCGRCAQRRAVRLGAAPGEAWHGFEGLADDHVMVDPIKVTILSRASRPMAPWRIREYRLRCHQVPVVAPDRDREDRPLFVPGPLLDGDHQGQVEHADYRAHQLQGPLRRERAAEPRAAALAALHPEAYDGVGLKDLCDRIHEVYREDDLPKAGARCTRSCPRWRCGRRTPTSGLVKAGRERRDRRPDGSHTGRDDRALSPASR